MVSFSCEACGDVLTKKKLDPHKGRCRGATFTCIDCMVHFPGTEYRAHTSCITEDQKYQGALYKNKKQKTNPTTPSSSKEDMSAMTFAAPVPLPAHFNHAAYVEDAPEDYDFEDLEDDDGASCDEAPPHAPTPPPAAEAQVNVFDYLVAGATPNASRLDLPQKQGDSTELVRYDSQVNAYLDEDGVMIDEDKQLVQYGSGPVPTATNATTFETPAPKAERRKTKDGSDKEAKKDKKRKRLHVDVPMMDAPPVLHSGLTGGLNRLSTRQVFPPSPGDSADAETPASPLKKTRHSKHSKTSRAELIGNNLISMLTSGAAPKTKTKKRKAASSPSAPKKSSSRRRKSDSEKSEKSDKPPKDKAPKLIEYRPSSSKSDGKDAGESQVVLYRPRADLLLSLVNKGPDSEKGCSMNKTLKRYHRERSTSGDSLGKLMEEKELWRSLRLRKNDRGEIVLFVSDS